MAGNLNLGRSYLITTVPCNIFIISKKVVHNGFEQLRFHRIFMKISSTDTSSVLPKSWQIFAVKIQDENEDTLIYLNPLWEPAKERCKIISRCRKLS